LLRTGAQYGGDEPVALDELLMEANNLERIPGRRTAISGKTSVITALRTDEVKNVICLQSQVSVWKQRAALRAAFLSGQKQEVGGAFSLQCSCLREAPQRNLKP